MLLGGQAAAVGPERLDLGENELTEEVARTGERERRVRVQALEPGGSGRSADPELERATLVRAGLGKLLMARKLPKASASSNLPNDSKS